MNFSLKLKEKLLPILVNRTVIFFFFMCLMTLATYIVGTVQGFIDSTQLSLLRLYSTLGIFLVVTSAYGVFLGLGRFLSSRKTRYLVRAGGYILLVIYGTTSVLAVAFIITMTGGNTGA